MDCLADLLSQKGLEGAHAWCEKGLKLKCRSSGETSSWIVFGQLPEEEGEGMTAATAFFKVAKQRSAQVYTFLVQHAVHWTLTYIPRKQSFTVTALCKVLAIYISNSDVVCPVNLLPSAI